MKIKNQSLRETAVSSSEIEAVSGGYAFVAPDKFILDPCCGSRMFWFEKQHPNVIYGDIRTESHVLCDGRQLNIAPDVEMDFTNMPFDNETFRMVVWDPPHLNKLAKDTWMAQKYGVLLPTWETDLKAGFRESMRVLKPYGVLIFKWNEIQIKLSQVLPLFNQEPLFGHVTGKHGRTIWLAFMKLPHAEGNDA